MSNTDILKQDSNLDEITRMFIEPLKNTIVSIIETDERIDSCELMWLVDNTRRRIAEDYGPDYVHDPKVRWTIRLENVTVSLIPNLGISRVVGGNREAAIEIEFPSGNVTQTMTYLGFV